MASAGGPAQTGPSARMGTAAGVRALEGEDPVCAPGISSNVRDTGVRGVKRVNYGGTLDCNFTLAAYAYTYLIDRTSGTSNDGGIISYGNTIDFGSGSSGISVGFRDIDGRTYDGGRKAEAGFYLRLRTLDGRPWAPCGDIGPDLRYLLPCEGVGTDTLTVRIGAGTFETGLGPYASLPVPRTGPGSVTRDEYTRQHHDYASNDIRVPDNTPVYAIKAGTVGFTSNDTGRCGVGIYIQADGIFYLYCHLTSRRVAIGAQVLAGDQIGVSGHTGGVPPHLHVELRTGRGTGTRYCPQTMLTAIYDGQTPPLPQQLPTIGCFYKSLKIKTDKVGYQAGEAPQYSVTSEEPNAPIYWSSTRNGASTGEVLAFYGHYTDGDGNFSAYGGAWPAGAVGSWTKTLTLPTEDGTIEDTVSFAVVPALTLSMNKTAYFVGETPFYTVTNAPPNTPIYWSSTRNGASTGEVNAFYGHYTDANGNFSAYGGPWQDVQTGTWTKSVTIGGRTSTFGFSVLTGPLARRSTVE